MDHAMMTPGCRGRRELPFTSSPRQPKSARASRRRTPDRALHARLNTVDVAAYVREVDEFFDFVTGLNHQSGSLTDIESDSFFGFGIRNDHIVCEVRLIEESFGDPAVWTGIGGEEGQADIISGVSGARRALYRT